MPHEVLLLSIWVAIVAATLGWNVVPDIWISVVVDVWSMIASNWVRRHVCSIGLRLIRSSCSSVEDSPVVVSRSSTGRTHVLWRIETGIRSRWRSEVWSRIRIGHPSTLIVGRLVTRLRSLERCSLDIAIVVVGVWEGSLNVGIDRCERHGSKTFESGLALQVLGLAPIGPAVKPCLEIVALLEVDIQAPSHRLQPVMLHSVQVLNSDAADLRPGAILERVIVQEFAAQEEADGEHTPNRPIADLETTGRTSIDDVHASREVVHTEKDSRAWESGRGEQARDELAECWRDRRSWIDDALSHLCDILRDLINFVVEHGTHTTRSHHEERSNGRRRLGGISVVQQEEASCS
jgi:hypothetical protein